MTPAEIVTVLEQKFGGKIKSKNLETMDPFAVIDPADLLEIGRFLRDDDRHRFVVKLILPRWKDNKPGELPEVPSVAGLWRTADWHEREVYDLSGVWFTGHPELTRILLAEDWVGHPLRKDYEYPLEYHGIRGR